MPMMYILTEYKPKYKPKQAERRACAQKHVGDFNYKRLSN